MGSAPLVLALATAVALAAGPRPAQACGDPQGQATTRRLGEEAAVLVAAGDFDGALERYRAALTVLPVTASCALPRADLQLLIARCLERLCRLDEALLMHRARSAATQQPGKGRLVLRLGMGVRAAEVLDADGRPVEPRCGGYLLPAGSYRARAETETGPAEGAAEVVAGQEVALTLEAPAPLAVSPAPAPVPPPPSAALAATPAPSPASPEGCPGCRTAAWYTLGAAALAVVGGGAAYGIALSANDDMESAAARQRRLASSDPPDADAADAAGDKAREAADTRDAAATASYVGLGLGAALGVATLVLLWMGTETEPAAVAPTASGLQVRF